MNPLYAHYIHAAALLIAMIVTGMGFTRFAIMYSAVKAGLASVALFVAMIFMMIVGGMFTMALLVTILKPLV